MRVRELPFVRAIDEGRRRTPIWLTYVVGILLAVLVVQVLIGAGIRLATGHSTDLSSFASQVIEGVTDLWPIAIVLLWVVLYERRPAGSLGLRDRRWWARMLVGLLLGGALVTLGALPSILSGQLVVTEGGPGTLTGSAAVGLVLATLPIWLIQGSSEEIVFRGFLLQRHLYSWPAWLAVVFLAALFAFIHPGGNLLAKLNITLFGIFVSLLVLRQGTLWTAMGIHAGWNMVQGNVLGIAVSGEARDNTLVRLSPADGSSAALTGGEFGTEASVYLTVVLVVVVAVAFVALRRHLARSGGDAEAGATTGVAVPA
ncbi:CPBP family intramembrane glutamic endopeptidase [Isoptericola sp. NPDC056618]|uniref:CPBP family intramembrane glutamic endopeptidase n=1 Tax=unclassified Isoptericola TaxID=2623355 RepID=UPI003651DC43